MAITNDNYELNEPIRMMNSQRSDVKKFNLIEKGKNIGINEVIKRNEFIKMESYCVRCKK